MKRMKSIIYSILLLCFLFGCYDDSNQEDIGKMIKPIKEYDNYFITDNKTLYGLNQDGLTKIDILDKEGKIRMLIDFFKFDGKLYLTIKEIINNIDQKNIIINLYYYKQNAGKIEKINALPKKPINSRSQLRSGAFLIQNFNYINPDTGEHILCSDIENLNMQTTSGIERFVLVNGYTEYMYNGLYFNVEKGRGKKRIPGLYFWPYDKTTVNRIKEKGLLY